MHEIAQKDHARIETRRTAVIRITRHTALNFLEYIVAV